jgi:hypothetical protein
MRTTASALSLTGRKRLRHRMRVHTFIGAIRRGAGRSFSLRRGCREDKRWGSRFGALRGGRSPAVKGA